MSTSHDRSQQRRVHFQGTFWIQESPRFTRPASLKDRSFQVCFMEPGGSNLERPVPLGRCRVLTPTSNRLNPSPCFRSIPSFCTSQNRLDQRRWISCCYNNLVMGASTRLENHRVRAILFSAARAAPNQQALPGAFSP